MEENRKHILSMANREKVTLTAVTDVESFDEEKVVVDTDLGMLTILGNDFRINKLNVDDGELVIEGHVDEIAYQDRQYKGKEGGFFSRLFQ